MDPRTLLDLPMIRLRLVDLQPLCSLSLLLEDFQLVPPQEERQYRGCGCVCFT